MLIGSNGLHIVSATPEHYESLLANSSEAVGAALCSAASAETFMRFIATGPAIALLNADRVIAVGGIWTADGGKVGTCWLLTSQEFGAYAKTALRCCRNMVAMAHEEYGMRRVQALILADHERNRRFAQACFLEWEGNMRCLAPDGTDMALYSSIRRPK